LKVVNEDIRHPLHITELTDVFHISHVQLDRIHEVFHVHRILTFLVQEHIHVEGWVITIGDSIMTIGIGIGIGIVIVIVTRWIIHTEFHHF
jgi:hypothetical protein